ncbi:MAG: Hsp70 family protein, partial [Candidatus Riflebacteria bacterium]|nr:Hsp70 family protein [Candidatus Riflebacteria bacterium]
MRAIGQEARAIARAEPQRAIWGVKRLLGKTYKEALEHGELGRMVVTVEADQENGRCMFALEDRDLRPEDVCADLLRHIRAVAEGQVGVDLSRAVVSVPAYFDAIAIGATVEAARRAGFESIDTIPEPVAAALAYDLPLTSRPVNFLVFDIGAGTLDVTAAEVTRTRPGPAGLACRALKHTGTTRLGGLDIDDRLVAHLEEQMKLLNLEAEDRHALRQAAEIAKIELTTKDQTVIRARLKGQECVYPLSRGELEQVIDDLIQMCKTQTLAALRGAQWNPSQVERLLLIVGPVAMPCILR